MGFAGGVGGTLSSEIGMAVSHIPGTVGVVVSLIGGAVGIVAGYIGTIGAGQVYAKLKKDEDTQ